MVGLSSATVEQGLQAEPRFGSRAAEREADGGVPPVKVLLVASGGGHWVQLMRVAPAFAEHDCAYVTTIEGCDAQLRDARIHLVRDANLSSRFRLLRLAVQIMMILLRERPDVVVSTGAAPGYFAVRFGKLLGARTVWVDSIANAEKLSLSGQKVGPYADMWLTQWPHLAGADGPRYCGAVI
jgi:UDP-N-acetylglucosamine:LPS N-acetylglucosamine transferase